MDEILLTQESENIKYIFWIFNEALSIIFWPETEMQNDAWMKVCFMFNCLGNYCNHLVTFLFRYVHTDYTVSENLDCSAIGDVSNRGCDPPYFAHSWWVILSPEVVW